MAINITWSTSVINVAKADMVLIQTVPSEIYQLDMNDFRLDLKDLEDSEDGIMFPDTHSHNPPVTISGAVLARVVEILSPYTITFEDDQYRVNVVGANTNIGERINVNQVSVSTSNSAGLQDLNSLQAASYGGEVTVKASSNDSGTTFPVGTKKNPVNNMTDALAIAVDHGITTIRFIEDMTLGTGDYSLGYEFLGNNPVNVTITLQAGADVEFCTFRNMTVQGVLDNGNILRDCSVLDITNINGFMHQCALSGTMTLGGGSQSTVMSCYSGVAGGALTPTIDMGGSGNPLALRDYSGGLKIMNSTGAGNHSLDFQSGQLIIDSTVAAGDFTIRGVCKVTDNSTGTSTISDETISKGVKTNTGIGSTILGNVL